MRRSNDECPVLCVFPSLRYDSHVGERLLLPIPTGELASITDMDRDALSAQPKRLRCRCLCAAWSASPTTAESISTDAHWK